MVLSITSDRAGRLARELVALTGETITDAVEASLEARLELERRRRRAGGLGDIVERYGALPVQDERPDEEILGYDEHSLPE